MSTAPTIWFALSLLAVLGLAIVARGERRRRRVAEGRYRGLFDNAVEGMFLTTPDGEVSQGGYSLIFWQFQNPPDLLFSAVKAMFMATVIVLVGCYYGYTAGGGPVGVGTATAKSMVLNIVLVHLIGALGTQVFWGANPRAPIGG